MQDKEWYRQYYLKNRARILREKKAYRAANGDKISEANRRWREDHAEELKEYQKEYNRRRYEENKARADQVKAGRGCIRCGENDPVCLEFHHRDPEQRNCQVAALCGFSWKKLEDEIALCDVVCANCHAITHFKDRRGPNGFRKRRLKQAELPFPSEDA